MKSTYTPPQKIISLRDDNELEYHCELMDKNKGTFFVYKYTKSRSKGQDLLMFTEKQIKDGIKHGTFAPC